MPQRLVWDFPESINPQIDMALSFAIKVGSVLFPLFWQ